MASSTRVASRPLLPLSKSPLNNYSRKFKRCSALKVLKPPFTELIINILTIDQVPLLTSMVRRPPPNIRDLPSREEPEGTSLRLILGKEQLLSEYTEGVLEEAPSLLDMHSSRNGESMSRKITKTEVMLTDPEEVVLLDLNSLGTTSTERVSQARPYTA
jgi:hypothetical protein